MIIAEKNIIILLKSFTLGGAEKQALFLAGYLQNNRNCNVHIYSYIASSGIELFHQECEKHQLKSLHITENPLSAAGKFKYLKRRIKLFLFGLKLRRHKPDIIIPYLNPPSIIASLCYKIAGAKHTFWHHRGVDYYRNDALEKRAAKHTPLFIANSEYGTLELQKKLKINSDKIHLLANFTTVDFEIAKNKKKETNLKDEIVIGMIAHFRNEKRQDILVKAFKKLIEVNKNIRLLLIGNVNKNSKKEQESFKEIQDYINENELNNNVKILHNTSGEEILPSIDIGVLLSLNEGMPNVIMEYMGYGLPVVTNKHSGCVALLGNDYNYFVDNTVESVVRKLNELILNAGARKRIGNQNLEQIQSDYSIEKYIINLETVLAL